MEKFNRLLGKRWNWLVVSVLILTHVISARAQNVVNYDTASIADVSTSVPSPELQQTGQLAPFGGVKLVATGDPRNPTYLKMEMENCPEGMVPLKDGSIFIRCVKDVPKTNIVCPSGQLPVSDARDGSVRCDFSYAEPVRSSSNNSVAPKPKQFKWRKQQGFGDRLGSFGNDQKGGFSPADPPQVPTAE